MIVSGPPGSGKTTIAVPLARALGLPLVAKDTVKEALMDALGVPDLERSRELGRASIFVLHALAVSFLDAGAGLVLESNFSRGVSEDGLRPLVARSRAVLVHCWADGEVLRTRYHQRAAGRHPGHLDLVRLDASPTWFGPAAAEPPDLDAPCLRVDTGAGCDADAVARWVRERLGRS